MIPSYNHGQFLAQTVHSVLSQTFTDLEVLILDDGSKDHSWDVIQKLTQQDHRIRSWRQDNAGLITTLNRLMDKTRGQYIALLGSDDVWLPERLAWGVEDMTQDQELSATFCAFLICDEHLNPTKHSHPQGLPAVFKGTDLVRTLIPHNNVGALIAFMRADAVRAAGPFARDLEACQDWDLWLRLSMQGTLNLRPDIGALYRWHGNNMSATNQRVRATDTVRVLQETSPLVARHYNLEDQVLHALALQTAKEAISVQKPEVAVEVLTQRSQQASLDGAGSLLLLYALMVTHKMDQARLLSHDIQVSGRLAGSPLQADFNKMAAALTAQPGA